MWELHGVTNEEDRRVVADEVVIALGRVELQRKSAHVTPGVRAAEFTGDRREPDQQIRLDAWLEQRRLRVGADVRGRLEHTEGATALGVGTSFRDVLAVEMRHLLDEVDIVQQQWTVGADGQRVPVARGRCTGTGRGSPQGSRLIGRHIRTSSFACLSIWVSRPDSARERSYRSDRRVGLVAGTDRG